jgi:CheY-like chemotaxis protein
MMQARLNLAKVVAILVDRDAFTRNLAAQMLRGFGVGTIIPAETGVNAKELIAAHQPDICFVEAELSDMPAADLLIWLRRHPNKTLRFVPIIVMSGYTQLRLISSARDAGAHLVVRKPVSPQTLFDRLVWVSHFDRSFIETDNYAGPDRRFRASDPPDGSFKRETDIPAASKIENVL